jgi:hypothetical protein
MATAHYADSFTVVPGRCFRLVNRPDAHGQPDHCPEPVTWHGTFTDGTGRRWEVDSCDGHASDLQNRISVPQSDSQ